MISALNKYNMTLAIMKGIAIVSVVAGHCTMYKVVENYVNQYHLAVFFFVAGYFLTDKYVNSPILLIKKLVPFYLIRIRAKSVLSTLIQKNKFLLLLER